MYSSLARPRQIDADMMLAEIGERTGRDVARLLPYAAALHDIGKPAAIAAGDKDRQHEFTLPMLQKTLEAVGVSARAVQ